MNGDGGGGGGGGRGGAKSLDMWNLIGGNKRCVFMKYNLWTAPDESNHLLFIIDDVIRLWQIALADPGGRDHEVRSPPSGFNFTIVVATERSQQNHIQKQVFSCVSLCDSAGFFQWQQL